MSQRQWRCDPCSTSFSRLEHLRRHLRSHENQRPYACGSCKKTFTRKDALKRHGRTCKELSRSTDANAITASTRQTEQSQDAYESLFLGAITSGSGQSDVHSPPDFTTLDWLYSSQLLPDSIDVAERLEFLAYFTSAKGMATFLDQDTLKQRQKILIDHEKREDPHGFVDDPTGQGGHAFLEHAFLNSSTNPLTTIEPSLTLAVPESETHGLKSEEIICRLQLLIVGKSDNSIINLHWTPSIEMSCRALFASENVCRFLDYFWSLWYPNCPIVHRPLFDFQTAHPVLVCVMVIIGACLSPHEEDGFLAKTWLDSVEELVFSSEILPQRPTLPTSDMEDVESKKKRVECIQMTYLVCSLQKREGSVEAQTRIRRYRHATLVSLARDIGLSASHRTLELKEPSLSWWRDFAIEEELIRSLTYVFLIDAALTILHNAPPRMMVSELKMDMACPEQCFQAESATGCFTALNQWKDSIFWRERLSVYTMVRRICQSSLSDHLVHEYSRMGTLNLFTIVQSLHSLTFHLRNSIIFDSTLAPVRTGLSNWRRIWNERDPEDRYTPDHPHTIWKKIGFVRYAPEFWHLARIMVDRIQSESDEHSPLSGTTESCRYDTDMMDVNDLIMQYRQLNLNSAI
ncbi:hypothetical protein BDV25DRAFT_136266 [Aspergillus avenaceus]|uniref:C2H2-type domain-containing protein n=1 Tax=Aspergillus avenaceus TaxID=36643 RepID=A0A5N6U6E7_ASPAV|nr:hypothetical protein BDV25DRAFT_136266 [Aspergillus avenaceus]